MKFFKLVPADTNIDFIRPFKLFMAISGLLLAATIFQIITRGFNYGIDFTGGTVFTVQLETPQPIDRVRESLSQLGAADASVVTAAPGNMEYMITSRTEDHSTTPLHKRYLEQVGESKAKLLQVDVVGPKVGKELRKSALLSLIYSIVLIMIYIWFRFDAKFAPGATIAMIHDIILASGFYLVSGREFTITSIAALLTIAGYSVNDTIVIYDRVRELLKMGAESLPLPQTINRAINLTLSRTLLTSLLTLLSVIPVAIFCTGEIQSFAMSMIVGLIVGSYSTIYIAAPFTIIAAKFMPSKNRLVTA